MGLSQAQALLIQRSRNRKTRHLPHRLNILWCDKNGVTVMSLNSCSKGVRWRYLAVTGPEWVRNPAKYMGPVPPKVGKGNVPKLGPNSDPWEWYPQTFGLCGSWLCFQRAPSFYRKNTLYLQLINFLSLLSAQKNWGPRGLLSFWTVSVPLIQAGNT